MSLNLLLTLYRLDARTPLVLGWYHLAVSICTSKGGRSAGSGLNPVEKIYRNSNTRAHASATNSSEPLISSPIEEACPLPTAFYIRPPGQRNPRLAPGSRIFLKAIRLQVLSLSLRRPGNLRWPGAWILLKVH